MLRLDSYISDKAGGLGLSGLTVQELANAGGSGEATVAVHPGTTPEGTIPVPSWEKIADWGNPRRSLASHAGSLTQLCSNKLQ